MQNVWWQDELATEIHYTLREKELTLPPYKARSSHLWMRRYFANLLSILSKHYELCPLTQHLAVYLLDLFMDCYDVNSMELYAVSVVCLLLASKFEERGDKVPMLEELNNNSHISKFHVVLTKKDRLEIELLLLKTINWNLCLPTPAHFIDYYLHFSVATTDRHNGCPITSKADAKYFIEKYSHYFLEVSLQDYNFLSFRPSVVAAACVAASRICLEITPSWSVLLHVITLYSWEHIAPCVDLMLVAHDNDIRAAKNENENENEKEKEALLQQQHMKSLIQLPARVVFQPSPCYYPQVQQQPICPDSQCPIRVLFSAYRASLQAPQSSSHASENSSSLPSVSTAQGTFEMVPIQTTSIQGPTVPMQVAISEDPAYYLSLILGNSYFSTYFSTAGCLEDEQNE